MVATSQNGYFANDRSLVTTISIPGGRVSCRKDYGIPVIAKELFTRFHNEVEPLEWPGNWGYASRPIRGSSTELSNHASATAWDANAPKHPLGKSGTFSSKQVKAIRKILNDFDGVLRWGGDYSRRKDEMHFEINKDEKSCQKLADKILKGGGTKPKVPAKPKPKPKGKREDAPTFKLKKGHWYGLESRNPKNHSGYWAEDRPGIKMFQSELRDRGWSIKVTGRFDKQTDKVVRQFQNEKFGYDDGGVGIETWTEIWEAPVT